MIDIAGQLTALQNAIVLVDDALDVGGIRLSVTTPAAVVYPRPPFALRDTFDGNGIGRYVVQLVVSFNDTEDAAAQLGAYLVSVPAMIETTVAGATVEELSGYGTIDVNDGGTQYLTAEFVVEVLS